MLLDNNFNIITIYYCKKLTKMYRMIEIRITTTDRNKLPENINLTFLSLFVRFSLQDVYCVDVISIVYVEVISSN